MNQVQNNLLVKVPNGQTLFQFIKKEDLKKLSLTEIKRFQFVVAKKSKKKTLNCELTLTSLCFSSLKITFCLLRNRNALVFCRV